MSAIQGAQTKYDETDSVVRRGLFRAEQRRSVPFAQVLLCIPPPATKARGGILFLPSS